ncbi:hypothetical protein [Natronomonas marina]|nr:hypothetical protein [Natronomonas marina]
MTTTPLAGRAAESGDDSRDDSDSRDSGPHIGAPATPARVGPTTRDRPW